LREPSDACAGGVGVGLRAAGVSHRGPELADQSQPTSLLLVPYQRRPAASYIVESVRELRIARTVPERFVVCVHAGVYSRAEDRLEPWMASADDAVDVDVLRHALSGASLGSAVFAGNWHGHRAFRGERYVEQVGSLCPTGWDNPGPSGYGRVAFWNEGLVDGLEVPGPRFVAGKTAAELAEQAARCAAGSTVYARLDSSPDDADARLALEAMLEMGVAEVVSVVDRSGVQEAAEAAAASARSAGTMREAVEQYVHRMPLPEGIDRERVRARTVRLLGEG
jgi:hypothetical protein